MKDEVAKKHIKASNQVEENGIEQLLLEKYPNGTNKHNSADD